VSWPAPHSHALPPWTGHSAWTLASPACSPPSSTHPLSFSAAAETCSGVPSWPSPCLGWLLQSPNAKQRIINWSAFASASVAALRGEVGRHPHDTTLRNLIDDVCHQDPEIAGWWADHAVRDYQSVSKRIQHPLLGTLDFDIEILQPTHDPDQRLIVYTTHAGSPTHEALRQLKDRQTTYAQPD
jgi:hypothetical protein